jgi:hypothetical protein
MTPLEKLEAATANIPLLLPTAIEGWDGIPDEYKTKLLEAGSRGASLLGGRGQARRTRAARWSKRGRPG